MASGGSGTGSFLLLEEYFASGDGRFLDQLRQLSDPKKLAAFTDRWARDHRPWAREQILFYLEQPLDRPGHQPVVKRLFKAAEARGDDELMGAFAVAFDRLVRRVRKTRHHYEWQTRTSWTEEALVAPRNTVKPPPTYKDWWSGKVIELPPPRMKAPPALFSYHTRYYLRRRAWRYFRRMGYRRQVDYLGAAVRFLTRYRDDDLARGENILDSWSLLHACFFEHDALAFNASHAVLKEGRSLAELSPAPMFPQLWKAAAAAPLLVWLVIESKARLVRVWAVRLIRRDHKGNLSGVAVADLFRLLDHAEEEVQELGAELLENAAGLAALPVADWLRLLQTRSLTALETIVRVMQRHVQPGRLTLFEAVTLATAKPVPVARMGLAFLKARPIVSATDRQAISNLARAQSAGAAREITAWALGILGAAGAYDVEQVIRFFDGLLKEVRDTAWDWLTETSPGWADPALWGRLLETPYDDVRLRLVEVLERRARLPGAGPADLAPLWASVLLGIHRGGRHKLTALRQISDAVRASPEQAERLMPVLAVAIRSVRLPEMRGGLAAIVSAVAETPSLSEVVAHHLPELNLSPEVQPA